MSTALEDILAYAPESPAAAPGTVADPPAHSDNLFGDSPAAVTLECVRPEAKSASGNRVYRLHLPTGEHTVGVLLEDLLRRQGVISAYEKPTVFSDAIYLEMATAERPQGVIHHALSEGILRLEALKQSFASGGRGSGSCNGLADMEDERWPGASVM